MLFVHENMPLARGIALAKARSSKIAINDLRHGTVMDLAAICGTAESSFRNWQHRYSTFPPLNKDGEYCLRECVWWYLLYKAPKARQLEFYEALTKNLGIKPSGSAVSDDATIETLGQTQREKIREMKELVELRKAQAGFEHDFGGVVRPRHVAGLLLEEFTKLREELEIIEKETGFPMRVNIQRMMDRLTQRLENLNSGGSDEDPE